jgi:uncharacterized protein (DUF433 family)
MSQQRDGRIVQKLMSIPHVEGRRIDVLTIHDVIEGRDDLDPERFAEEYGLDLADVYHALAYYHDHPEEMAECRDRKEKQAEKAREKARKYRPDSVTPSGDA